VETTNHWRDVGFKFGKMKTNPRAENAVEPPDFVSDLFLSGSSVYDYSYLVFLFCEVKCLFCDYKTLNHRNSPLSFSSAGTVQSVSLPGAPPGASTNMLRLSTAT
jgi:hypothetical protein